MSRSTSGLLFVTVAGEHRETRVFGVARIGEGEIAQDEGRAVGRFDAARMKTIGTEASSQGIMRLLPCVRHESRIAQCAGALIVRMKCSSDVS
jgi:hypothetical protein